MKKTVYAASACIGAAILTCVAGALAAAGGAAFGWFLIGGCVPVFLVGAAVGIYFLMKEKKTAAEKARAEEEERAAADRVMQSRRPDAEISEIFEKENKQ